MATSVKDYYGRSSAALAVILLHVGIIAALLNSLALETTKRPREKEITLVLVPAERARLRPPGITGGHARATRPDAITVPRLILPDVPGFGFALNSCGPDNLSNLDNEQRAKCTTAITRYDRTAMNVLESHAENEARWRRELVIKQTPLLLPCADPNNSALAIINIGTAICLGDLLLNGYNPDKRQHYEK